MTDKTPAQLEAEGAETITVDWNGIPVTVPATVDQLDLDAIEALEAGKAVTAIRAIVGSRAFDKLKADYAKQHGRPKVSDLEAMVEALAKAYGFDTSGN